ncbi:diaminobutyrate acetyltransferase [Coraliomargarita sinensis]|uniref:diaminobutyrate acetyltransferase n=1 Tax=Coraliomargarita sinensis TaxID=2174842 RepID=UPI0022B8D1BE|nr:diaminobutyrate acetyltransferase [Coraliomargarita sinensis]
MQFQHPTAEDGFNVNQLIADSPPLDTNSVYCNLLQCSHFAQTCIIAKEDDQVMGFVSGYRIPDRPEVLFVWQVVVSAKARGQGLAGRMIQALLESDACREVTHIETSITSDNDASWGLFKKLAKKLNAATSETVLFDKEAHFGGQHDSEMLFRIGPFSH